MIKNWFYFGIFSICNDPSLRRTGVFIRQGYKGLIFQQGITWFFGSIEQIGIAQGPTFRFKIDHELKVLGSNRSLRIREVSGAGGVDMTFPTRYHGISTWVHLTILFRLQYFPQTLGRHHLRNLDLTRFKKSRGQVGKADEIIHHPATFHTRPGNGQAHAGTKIVEVTLTMWKTGRTMISTDHDDCILILPRFLQFLDQDSQTGIESSYLTQVIGQILSDCMNIRQKCGHLAL